MKKVFTILTLALLLFTLNSCENKLDKANDYLKQAKEHNINNQFDLALETLNEAIELNPELAEAYFVRANVKRNLKRDDEAMSDLDKAIELKPDFADAYHNRGELKKYYGDAEGACEDYIMAFTLGKPNMGDKIKHCQ